MTQGHARGVKPDTLNDASVGEYLQACPDFFERNGALLAKLRLPHLRDAGATVSLVERQVEVLRERNQALERKLKELVDVARANDGLADRIHRLTQRLIRAHDAERHRERDRDQPAGGFRREELGSGAVHGGRSHAR